MIPVTKLQLASLENEDKVCKSLVQDIVVHRIANEIFANASKGLTRYSCDVASSDVIPFVARLFKMFPDCTIEISGNVALDWSCITVKW
jgi:hypothetical protein